MSEKEKPREFWLSETGTIKDVIFYSVYRNKEDTLNPYGKGLQVIEKSAYTELLLEAKALREALDGFRIGHEHAPMLPHTRALGDTYGWCDFCHTKVTWGPGDAEEALARFDAYLKSEEK